MKHAQEIINDLHMAEAERQVGVDAIIDHLRNHVPQSLVDMAHNIRPRLDSLHGPAIDFVFPFDWPTFRMARRLLGKGWKQQQAWGGDAYQAFVYKHPDSRVAYEFSLWTNKEGATCKKVKVGYEKVAKYEIQCDQQ